MQPLPQIAAGFIEGDGLHGGDAGQGGGQRLRQRRYQDAIGFQLGQQFAVGFDPQAYVYHFSWQPGFTDPGMVGTDIPHCQRCHPQRQQGFGYGPVDGSDTGRRTTYLCGNGLRFGLRRKWQ